MAVLLLLGFAALDDITTGSEPDYLGEWAILTVSAVVFGVLGWGRVISDWELVGFVGLK